ncbi:MAG: ABC transporter ATP-binding protein [Rhodocyclaceae bacterium]|nr:ABC transporter ATP-binding protein [Rhodocyclaceae bacterium]
MGIRVDGLGKAYPRFRSRRHALATWLGLCPRDLCWVLRDVSFTVEQGESVGLVGVNGAGKSTLLKLIAGTTVPTTGSVSVNGRIAALLELGMGFHPEFTGRENVVLSARMQGFSPEEIDALVPSIQAFAEIGDYFDQPVRIYSSGMFVRLAFSAATAVRPEILIVDEALAVGDAYFQHKSFARIRSFREQGTTLLFVSHDPGSIKSLCDRAILLNESRIIADAPPAEVLDYYNALIAEKEANAVQLKENRYGGRSGNGMATFLSVTFESKGKPAKIVEVGADLDICLTLVAHQAIPDLSVGFMLKDRTGLDIFGSNTWLRGELASLGDAPGVPRKLRIRIPALNVGPGSYSLTLALHSGASHLQGNFDWWDNAEVFQVVPDSGRKHFLGVCALDAVLIDDDAGADA